MKIESSLDWAIISSGLNSQLHKLDNNTDLIKMCKNIDSMVSTLSRLEVEARRTHIEHYIKPQVDKINKAISQLEKLLLIAKLMS